MSVFSLQDEGLLDARQLRMVSRSWFSLWTGVKARGHTQGGSQGSAKPNPKGGSELWAMVRDYIRGIPMTVKNLIYEDVRSFFGRGQCRQGNKMGQFGEQVNYS